MRYLILLLVLPLLAGCLTQSEGISRGEIISQQTKAKRCVDCTATDFPGGNNFTETFCAAPGNCVNGNAQILRHAANEKCGSLNTNMCTGTCTGSRECEGIIDPNSNLGGLNVAAVAGAACPGGTKVNCTVTVTIPVGQRVDCKCTCNL